MKVLPNIIATIKEKVVGLRETLRLLTAAARHPAGQQLNVKYGSIRTEAARLSANVREVGHDLFAGSTTDHDKIRIRQAHIDDLTDAKAEVEGLSRQLGAALQAEKETLATEIDETVQVLGHLYGNPLTDAKIRERLAPYGEALLALVADKNATVTARRLGTVALKQELSQASTTEAQIKLKNKYLEEGTLRPDDLTPPPGAAQLVAPKASKRRRTRR